ncbi:MAG: 3-dehydroquinate synthase [Ruminococcaceae bacterium]|nr:3-dehydroquinate synthase [Oscillospiraceae bacterium]
MTDSTMKTITINTSHRYDVLIGNGLLKKTGELILKIHPPCKIAIISDTNVAPLYMNEVKRSLNRTGFNVCDYVFKAGEKSKNMDTLFMILEFLADAEITKTDLILALGGGVVGDIAGFAASIYLRGINFVEMPTTLLAAVDSSVGGKTGVNLPSGKNLVGAFHQPIRVICDTDTLKSLPEINIADGIAEAIKYGLLGNVKILEVLDNYNETIYEAVTTKASFVEKDEFNTNFRNFLNLGHTIGHAIEKCSNYSISHGHAIAAGMSIITKAFEKLGYTNPGTSENLKKLLARYNLPITSNFSSSELYEVALKDKKRSGDTFTLVVPISLHKWELRTIPISDLKAIIELGL